MNNNEGLGNKPIIVIIGLIASCIAIFAFVTGFQSLSDILNLGQNKPDTSPYSVINSTPTSNQVAQPFIQVTATSVTLPESNNDFSSQPTIYDKRTRATDGMIQVYVPVEQGFGGFWIDQTEITGNQYMLCVNSGVCDNRGEGVGGDYPASLTGNFADDYCKWAGARLPNRDEWLRAATGIDGRIYPWGNIWDSNKANTSSGSDGKGLLPVGSFPSGASPYGVLDMAGNAFEWVIDATCDDGFRLQGSGGYASSPEDFSPITSTCLNPSNFWINTSARCVNK